MGLDLNSKTDPIQQLIKFTLAHYTQILPHFVMVHAYQTSFDVILPRRFVLSVFTHLQFALYVCQQTTYKYEQNVYEDMRRDKLIVIQYVKMSFT